MLHEINIMRQTKIPQTPCRQYRKVLIFSNEEEEEFSNRGVRYKHNATNKDPQTPCRRYGKVLIFSNEEEEEEEEA